MRVGLTETMAKLQAAIYPEDVFGPAETNDDLHESYRILVKAVHPDTYVSLSRKALAEAAFKLLQDWYEKAVAKLEACTYGDRTAISRITITNGKNQYVVTSRLVSGNLSELYVGETAGKYPKVVIKVARTPTVNDLLANEAKVLNSIKGENPVVYHVPYLLDAFQLVEGKTRRQVNVMAWRRDGGVTFEEIRNAYPNGIDPRDMAWMFNRLLAALMVSYDAGYVHGAVVPSHMMVYPKSHDGMLVDWSYSVKVGGTIKAIVPQWKLFYPSEVTAKQPADFSTDIYMAARCALYLVGTQPLPRLLKGLLNACLLGRAHRSRDVYELYKEYQEVLTALYGPKKFRVFEMPNTKEE